MTADAADKELRAALVKLANVAFEIDGLVMPARVRLRLQADLKHAGEAAERAVRMARGERRE